ncbi:uncharacterized protein LOC110892402 [Helianthus annuus]|uniref:uncharacterized protein LOC110892402 n=1 Tax=Helianthus annuus TaxID=4232 RepID=UPI000B8F9CCF|nr:uncharacterized protein LOC110892402 [Helianthus annuus]
MEQTYRVENFDPKTDEKEQQHLDLPTEPTYQVEKDDPKTEEVEEQQHLESHKPIKRVEIIKCDGEPSPTASEILREISEQKRKCDKLNKRLESLATWNWEEVINVSSDHGASEDDPNPDYEMADTADSMESFWKKSKIPRAEIRTRERVVQVDSV